jgi:HK97 family phage major capsid protein
MKAGIKYNLVDQAQKAVDSGMTEAAFNKQVLDAMDTGSVIIPGIDRAKVGPASGDKPFRNLGEQLLVVRDHAKAAGRKAPDTRLLQIVDAASGATEGTDSDAGFMVQTDFSGHLQQGMMENSNLINRCFNVPVGPGANGIWLTIVDESSRETGSRWGGVQVYRVAEAEAATAKKPKLKKEYMALEKMMGLCYATEESLQDSVSYGALIQRSFAEEFGFKTDDEIINGLGSGQMQGILKSPALVSITKETGQAAATIETDNILKMYTAMPPRGKANGVWLVNFEVWQQLPKLSLPVGTGGAPIFMPPGGISGAPYGALLGRPVIEVEQCAALGTVGDIIFADLSQYLTIAKGGLNAQSSIHVKFTTDETAFKFTVRNNGQSLWRSATTPYKGTQTRSPFVALATRS